MQYETLDYHRTTAPPHHRTTETGKLGLSSKDEGSATSETRLQNASLASGGNVHILSGADLTLAATHVVANGDINLEAVDHLLIAAGEVLSSSKQWQNESRAFSGGDAYHSEEHTSGESVTGAQASTLIAGGRVTARAGTGQVIGSDISGAQGVDLKSDAGDFVVNAAQTSRETYSHDKEISVGFGDITEMASHPEDMIKSKDGRLTFKIANAQYDDVDNKAAATDMRGSTISSNGDVSIESSAGKVIVTGSELAADTDMDGNGDVNLSGATGIDIGAATNTYSTSTDETHGSAEMSIVVQNQYAEVVMAYQRLEEAKEKLEDSKRQYKDYERNLDQLENQLGQLETDYANKSPGVHYDDLVELRALVEDVKDDKDWYVAGITLASLNLASASNALVTQVIAAGASTTLFGFNGGLQLDVDASQTDSEFKSTTAVASTLSGQNINLQTGVRNGDGQLITAGTVTNIEGSNLLATNRIGINTGDLNVTASKNTSQSNTETAHGHVTAQVTVYGAAGGASVNASFDRSKNSDRSTTYNNSNLLADKIDITTSGDTTIRGGTVRAESELNADIQGNLTVESVQNRSSSRNSSAGVSGGFSLGGNAEQSDEPKPENEDTNTFTRDLRGVGDVGGLAGVNGGFNVGNGMSSTRETVLSSLTSGGTANINVKNHTQITGAAIGTTDANGNDLNQLNLTTDTIGFADLRDTNISSQTSGGLSTNVGISGSSNTATNNTGGELLPGTTNLTYNNSQQNSASKSLATLGHGNITVGGTQLEQNGELTDAGEAGNSALAGLNRDTSNTDKNLWSSDYSQEVDATIDNRLFTEEGRAEIAYQSEHFGENLQIVAKNVPSANNSNQILAAIGSALDLASYATIGVIPSDRFDGGLVANIPVLFGAQDISHKVLQVVTADSAYMQQNPDLFIPLTESEYYMSASEGNQKAMREQGLYITRDPVAIDSSNATYQNFTNGMFNREGDAIKNGLDQTGSGFFTLNYNPTHGFLGDILECGVDSLGGTTGAAKQTGEFIYDVTTARGMAGSNFAAHSQGNLLTASGINYRNNNGGFMPQSYFVDESKSTPEERNAGVPTFASYGSPVNTKDMKEILQGKEGDQFRYSGAYTKENDFVGEVLGGNKDQDGQMSSVGQALNSPNFWMLFGEGSPHSTYLCQDHDGAKQNCGYRP